MPLKVLIVGAGLGGLGAAIALGQSGHEVLVFEQSKFLHEVGAAIHVPPNASRILSSWGLDFEAMQAVRCERLQVWDAMGNHLWTPIVTEDYQRSLGISDGWFLTHRVDLHNALRATAARQNRVQIRLSSRVAYVDADAGVVTLEDGSTFTGDLVLGADGIHSKSVSAITGEEQWKECTGQNCFRFLVPVSKLQANPLTASFLEKVKLDGMHAFTSPDRRLLMYPCCGGTLLNMAGIFPSNTMARATNTSWLQSGNLEDLLKTFQDFSPELLEICRQAEDVKLWSLATRQAPRTFVRGKLALMGDAAHPTLPHQGQGGAQSFEDGAALGALFPQDTTPAEVAHRLMLYNKTRYDRAITVMMMSKVPHDQREQMLGELRTYVPNAEIPEDMWTYTWPSDPAHEARCLLVSA